MEQTRVKQKKFRLRELAPMRLILCLVCAVVVAAYYALRGNAEFMSRFCERVTRPVHESMSRLCAGAGFSVAELIWFLAALFAVVYIIVQIISIIKLERKWHRVYVTLLTLLTLGLMFWAGFCALWSPCYYAPTFSRQSGLSDAPISAADLEDVTRFFAHRANELAGETQRDADGLFIADREEILDASASVYGLLAEKYPFLSGDGLRPKPVFFSRFMSRLGFTGFFFPMTGEANLNMDSPVCMLPATAQHEISHQRGVAMEQECNFLAVLACMDSGRPDFAYSGALLAYIHLSNALHGADREAWETIWDELNEPVRADLAVNSGYWRQFEDSLTQKTSEKIYEAFLIDNNQTLGLKSYGACVDLLVNYYK